MVFLLAGCESVPGPACTSTEQSLINNRLYFGTSTPNGVVSDAQWSEFLRSAVTPRFPDGLTAWRASGQWRSSTGEITKEQSYVLDLVHPESDAAESSVKQIVADYVSRFRQESVMRVRSRVCVTF